MRRLEDIRRARNSEQETNDRAAVRAGNKALYVALWETYYRHDYVFYCYYNFFPDTTQNPLYL